MTVLEIGLNNGSVLLERLGADVPNTQFVRELTQNALDAGAKNIDFDMDWNQYKSDGVKKLMIVDDGEGMDGEEMIEYINKLASGTNHLSLQDNFGNGGKTSTFPKNPEGTIYLSRKGGVNYQCMFQKDKDTGLWGLFQYERPNGTYGYYNEIDDSLMPRLIMKSGHGTAVVLMGKEAADNTMLAPKGSQFKGFNWIIKELNSRFYKLPSDVKVRVNQFNNLKDGIGTHGWITIKGNGYFTERFSESSGIVELTNGRALWFVIKEEEQNTRRSGVYVTSGHVACLYQNELYGRRTGRMLQNFDINFNTKRVVIYISPSEAYGAYSNSGRTDLIVGQGDPFPWDDFADEFRENMPEELIKLESEAAKASTKKVDQSSIDRNLKSIYKDFLKISKYRPVDDGENRIKKTDESAGGRGLEIGINKKKKSEESNKPSRPGGATGNIYEMRQTRQGDPASEVEVIQLPDVYWLSIKDGTRVANDELEDKAASYAPRTKSIRANGDYRGFLDTERQMLEQYKNRLIPENVISEIVRKWYEQELKEIILVAEQLRDTKIWAGPSADNLTSPEALTCAVLPKYNILQSIQGEIEIVIKDSSTRAA